MIEVMAVSLDILSSSQSPGRKPPWLKMKMPAGEEFARLYNLVNDHRLHTVCQSAKCPNMGECWAAGTATLMIRSLSRVILPDERIIGPSPFVKRFAAKAAVAEDEDARGAGVCAASSAR